MNMKAHIRVGTVLRVGLGLVFACKLGLVLWSSGGIPGALALAAEGTAGHATAGTAKPGEAKPAAVKPPDVKAVAPQAAEGGGAAEAGKGQEPRAMIEAITHRQAELDARERELTGREEHLKVYEQDVTAKIASLEEIEKRLQVRAKAASAAIDSAAESLAKVYGAMKPQDAAPILERLDESTVLTIFGRMKEKQIGEILPLMSKEKAIALTQALAASASR
jgi:flagellar motility protein MotE (MotC chaperone)